MARKMPAIPQDAAAGFQAMKEIIERREGVRGDKSDAFVTLADLQPERLQLATLLNGWVNAAGVSGYDSQHARAGFYKDKFGRVHLTGFIKDGTANSVAFVLPPGYRPQYRQMFAAISNNAIGRIDLFANGDVIPASPPSSNVWISLDGISFRVA